MGDMVGKVFYGVKLSEKQLEKIKPLFYRTEKDVKHPGWDEEVEIDRGDIHVGDDHHNNESLE